MVMETLILCIMASLVFTFSLASSPLLMGLWVLMIAMSLSGWMGVMGMSWFGLILFLIYIGGMLVMFVYFVAITPNQHHDPKIFLALFLVLMVLFGLLYGVSLPKCLSVETFFSSSEMLYCFSQGAVLVLIFIMLFIGLLMVVKITRLVQGPLRPFC